ncbi:outer membrane beta-barrel protein [Salmonella enterica subsp. diarizonae serovar 16:z10:e,n,x,z15]|uniref:Ail/Lom family outer membrane beta-barrel protein n=1 Tax=Salmonella enterica TaxID=28901 RepID=UPI001F0ECF99|nr:outer membrane beta-barrel protein [Salmonella enterica subsp. diarizonae]MCH5482557.1 outer membrane beta-barrel protein [Salmonella enterica subsp. diarizonae serovar 16:z10:e,n,x,z15]
MKKIAAAVLVGLALGSVGVVNAESRNTVSIGYAYTDLSGYISGNANGANLKYNWEDLDSGFGVMGSVTYTTADIENGYGNKVGDGYYTSTLVGPSYRFNDYINAYVMIGVGNGRLNDYLGNSYDKTSFAYGAGIQVNPVEHIAVNASYEHASFSTDADGNINAGTWVLGVGYSF